MIYTIILILALGAITIWTDRSTKKIPNWAIASVSIISISLGVHNGNYTSFSMVLIGIAAILLFAITQTDKIRAGDAKLLISYLFILNSEQEITPMIAAALICVSLLWAYVELLVRELRQLSIRRMKERVTPRQAVSSLIIIAGYIGIARSIGIFTTSTIIIMLAVLGIGYIANLLPRRWQEISAAIIFTTSLAITRYQTIDLIIGIVAFLISQVTTMCTKKRMVRTAFAGAAMAGAMITYLYMLQ